MKSHKFPYGIGLCIVGTVLFIIGLMLSCGKLSDDTNRPTVPIGTSAGIPIPIERRSSLGTYTLTAWADPDTVPADMATYAIVHAQLVDTSGRSVENFEVEFEAELGYLVNDPVGPSTLSTTATGITGKSGTVSLYYYGSRAGSDQVQVRVDLDRDGIQDLFVTTLIMVTGAPGVPGTGRPGVELAVNPVSTYSEVDCTTVQTGTEEITLTATVWDESGDRVGAGVRVELSGDVVVDSQRWGETDSAGQATWEYTIDWASQITTGPTQTFTWTFLATVIINDRTYTDTATFSVVLYCTTPEPTPTPVPTVELRFVSPDSFSTDADVIADYNEVTFQLFVDSVPKQGVTVNFAVTGDGNPTLQVPPTDVTDIGGFAIAEITTDDLAVGDQITITAWVDYQGVTDTVTQTIPVEAP